MDRENRDVDHLEQIAELIAAIKRRTSELNRDSFEADRDESDLAAFRLAHIGEISRRLSQELRDRNSHIDWRSIYGMRNVIAHNYGAILPRLLWNVIAKDLDVLSHMCHTELGRLAP